MGEGASELRVIEPLPVVARGELRAGEHLVERGDRRDEEPAGEGHREQLRLRPGPRAGLDARLHPFELGERLRSREQQIAVADPVLVARGGVAEALLVDTLPQPSCERTDGRTKAEGYRNVAGTGREDEWQCNGAVTDAAREPP